MTPMSSILVHGLVIDKSNNAPIETLELPDGTTADLPTANEGETVTFTLHYTFSGDPVTNGIDHGRPARRVSSTWSAPRPTTPSSPSPATTRPPGR